jgi:hypothetical protein
MPKRPKGTPYRAYWADWTPAIAEMFEPMSILCLDMQPPARIRVYPGKRTLTLIAAFAADNGNRTTIKLKTGRSS